MSSRSLPLLVLVIATLAVLVLSFTNGTSVPLSLFGPTMQIPEGLLLGGGYVLGVILTLPLFYLRAAQDATSQKRLTEWEAQDKKLASQVQSDREKQLEAKIATLEAALQRALKK